MSYSESILYTTSVAGNIESMRGSGFEWEVLEWCGSYQWEWVQNTGATPQAFAENVQPESQEAGITITL